MSAVKRVRNSREAAALDKMRDFAPMATPSPEQETTASNLNIDQPTIEQPTMDRALGSYLDISVPRSTPAPLRGTYQVLLHQNIVADVEGLKRIQNDAELNAMVRSGSLVALPASAGLVIDPRLSYNRRYSRPWTARFLVDLTRAHERFFGDPLVLTSAVRTVSFQRHLAHYNGNAAPAYGDTASPHLTGQAVDIGKKGMSLREIAWMRSVLGQLQASGKLDVEEEFQQACFHISVYKTYLPHKEFPVHLVASNDPSAAHADSLAANVTAEEALAESAPSAAVAVRSSRPRRHSRRYEVHHTRRVGVRHRRRHRRSMSLLAAGLR